MTTLASIAHHERWVGWKRETRNGRPTKLPFDPRTGTHAATDDPSTWATRDEAKWWAGSQHGDGCGLVLGVTGDECICGIDLDRCRDKTTGELARWAQAVIDRFATYAEISPSETGVKLFFTTASTDLPAVEALFDGKFGRVFKNGGGEHPPAIEVYRGRRYFVVTEESCGPTDDLREVSLADLEWLIRDAGPKFAGHSGGKPNDDSRSAKAFRTGAALKASGASYEEMRDALLGHKDPEIVEWARSKGMENGERELRRIYDRAPTGTGVISLRAPYDTARLFQRGLTTPLRHHRGSFFEWNSCVWPEVEEAMLRARLYAFLDQCLTRAKRGGLIPVKPTAVMVGGVLDALRAAAQLDGSIEPPTWLNDVSGPPAHELVACANGLLHLPHRMLLPHTSAYFNHNALDFAHDPDAPEPRQWLDFLRQLWPKDDEAIDTLQEIFGYGLTSDTSQQKAFALIGPKRSGKGTIGRVFTNLIGAHNCVAPTLAGLGTNFGLAPLIGKRAAIISDARLSGRADQHAIAERILSITGEDALTIDRKYAAAWTGRLQTRFLILSNELFRLADASGALASRFILLMLTKSFYGCEDQNLTAKLLTELPGILNWAIVGWARLKRVGHFRQPASAAEAVEQLEDLASPIGAFVRERCETGAAYTVGVEEIFGAWKTWCEAQGRDHPGTKQSFGRDLRSVFPELKTTQPRADGKQIRAYQGLRLRSTDGGGGWRT